MNWILRPLTTEPATASSRAGTDTRSVAGTRARSCSAWGSRCCTAAAARTQHPGSGGGDLPVFHRRGAPQSARLAAVEHADSGRLCCCARGGAEEVWTPEILDTQFTSEKWLAPLRAADVAIIMDGKGR